MRRARTLSRTLFAAGALLAIAAGAIAPAFAQPATTRTPNVEGTWVTPGGTMFFSFLHRFNVGAAPSYSVGNIPTFHLSGGFYDWLSVGALYATETATVVGASQELELWTKQRLWDEEAGAPMSLSIKEAFNTTAFSPDAELNASRHFGPLGLNAAVRAMGNFRYTSTPRVTGALGLSYMLTPYLSLALDVAASPMRQATEPALAWGAGAQMLIPGSPHTLSLQVTNTGTDSIHGSSVATPDTRYGFDFTIPLNSVQQWLDIFRPAASQAAVTTPVATPASVPTTAPSAVGTPVPAARPSTVAAPRFDAKGFFAANCASCHGAQGQGGFGPNLKPVEVKGDPFIAMRIVKGSNKGMPPYGGRLTPEELAVLVGFVKGL